MCFRLEIFSDEPQNQFQQKSVKSFIRN